MHRRVHQIEVLEQHVFNSLQLQQVQQAEHTQHFCALIAEVEQQLACWVSTVQIVERTQVNVLVCCSSFCSVENDAWKC